MQRLNLPQSEGEFIIDTNASNVGMRAVLSQSSRWSREKYFLLQ